MSSSANIPGDTASFYDVQPLEPSLLYQGEILWGVPLLGMPKPNSWQLLRTKSGRRIHDALQHGGLGGLVKVLDSNLSTEQWYSDGLGDYTMAVLDKRPAVVLNQTCDVQSKHFVQIAPIFPVGADSGFLERLKNGEVLSAFWIDAHSPEITEAAFADLELIQAIHKSYLKRIRPGQHFRLGAARTRMLQSAITRYFGRPNSFDSRSDAAPRSGTYLCVRCFYMDGVAQSTDVEEGGTFPTCPACSGMQWVLQGH